MISLQLAFSRALRTYTRPPRGEPRRIGPAKLWNDPYRYLGLELAQPRAEAEWLRARYGFPPARFSRSAMRANSGSEVACILCIMWLR